MNTALRLVLKILGLSAILIASSILVLGADATAQTFEAAFDSVTGYGGPRSEPWSPSADSELRFYAALWGAYGVVLVMTARRLEVHSARVPWLAAVFFLGGLGRLASAAQVGPPHPFFQLLTASELVIPVLIVLLWLAVRRQSIR